MRRFCLVLSMLAGVALAADPFTGDWALDPAKSSVANGPAAKAGRALFEPDNAGGYLQFSETVLDGAPVMRFTSRAQMDGTIGYGSFENRRIAYRTRRIDPNAFEIVILDPKTNQASRTIHVSSHDDTLTMHWSDPERTLVYRRMPLGPMLGVGKPVEHDFGPARADEYRIHLKAGQYCQGKVVQREGMINLAAYAPDGSRLRFIGGPGGEKPFVIDAPVEGDYRIALRSADRPASSYAISVDRIVEFDDRPVASPSKERSTSQRIAALRKDVQDGNAAAVAAFWHEVEQKGTPLVEDLKENGAEALVTFLWRATVPTRNVLVLFFPYTPAHPADFQLAHLAGTDVWYRSLKVRKGARFTYQLSPNDPLSFDETSVARSATAQADPLNPNRWFDNPGSSRWEYQSRAEMPGARPQPYVAKREGVAAGTVERTRFKSDLLGNERDVSVYTPAAYRKEAAPYGLLVVFDESSYLTLVPTPVILDNLVADGKIAPMVAVLIGNPDQQTRTRELPPNPKFADFLKNELLPWVHQNYNVTSDPKQVVVAGSSFGGIASVYAGLRHPETFGNILCQSGSFWWSAEKPEPYAEPNYLAKEFVKSPKLPLRFYMDAGTFEVDLSGNGGAILEPSRHMRDVLLAKGYEVHYQENVGGHDYLSWRGSLADGLIALVGK